MVEDVVGLQNGASQEELCVQRVPAGRRKIRPKRRQLPAALLAHADPVIQGLDVGEVDQRSQERPFYKRRFFEGRGRRHESAKGAVGLLDGASKLAPKPHEQVELQEGHVVRHLTTGVAQDCGIEVTTGVRVSKHQNLIERNAPGALR